jgi:hypothetical protein
MAGLHVLHKETKGVKLNGTQTFTSKLANREKITDSVLNTKHIIEFKRVS